MDLPSQINSRFVDDFLIEETTLDRMLHSDDLHDGRKTERTMSNS